jgi:hypothetical protein
MIGVTAQYFARPDEEEQFTGFAPVDVNSEAA